MAMHTPQINYYKAIIVFILLNLCFLSGCGNESAAKQNTAKNTAPSTDAEKTNQASDNIGDLLNIVRLPIVPDEVVWREDANAKPKKIIAVLKFAKEDLQSFLDLIGKEKISDSVEVGVENWFPQELTAQAQLSGEGVLKGTAYSAKEFYNIPYGNGRITRIYGTDFFVLELTADN